MKLNRSIKSKFDTDGYYTSDGLFSKKEIKDFEKEFDKIIKQIKLTNEGINARWGSNLTKKIESDNSVVLHTHNVQSYSSTMLKMIQNKRFLDIAELLIGPDIILHHTKLFLKPSKIGSAFPLHQDWSYFPTKKNSMIAAVVHLSKSNEKMGCLRVVPKSHKLGKIQSSDGHTWNKKIHQNHDLESTFPIVAKKGDVLFFHCCTIHGSFPNTSSFDRKTVLIQLYSGQDKIIGENNHTNVQLVLRGWNHSATRNTVNNILS